MKSVEISETMHAAVQFAWKNGGKLTRHPGGFWRDAGPTMDRWGGTWFGTPTIEALVKRGLATYTQWKESGNRRFPIEMTMIEGKLEDDEPEQANAV